MMGGRMPAITPIDPRRNQILAALKPDEFSRLLPAIEAVELQVGQVLHEAASGIKSVYFPTDCILSMISATEAGATAELAMIGNDGFIGIPLVLGGESMLHRIVVQQPGGAFRLSAEVARWEFNQGRDLQRLALRFIQGLMTQICQIALCSRHHTVDQQICRWLLMTLDRLPETRIEMTQAQIANMLGVRRAEVSAAASRLQHAGLIEYKRGRLAVIDRVGLASNACECNEVLDRECNRLGAVAPPMRDRPWLRSNPASLRLLALARMRHFPPPQLTGPGDVGRLVHELQVDQIELEMQNEELARAFTDSNALQQRYADIYDFAPVAYVGIDARSVIRQINLAGAILLTIKRSELSKHRFGAFVTDEYLQVFNGFLAATLEGDSQQACEIELRPTDHRGLVRVRIDAVADEGLKECHMVISDISAPILSGQS
jgi:CRP-like cAMP-binding protein